MELGKVHSLVNEYRRKIKDIEKNYKGVGTIEDHQREQNKYIGLFKKFGISGITLDIYISRNNPKGIQEIKDNIEKYLIKE